MLTLYQYFPDAKSPDPSPFCVKVDFFLKLSKLPYQVKVGNPLKSPRKKLPVLQDGEHIVCDSQEIIRYLSKAYNIDLDQHLSEQQKAWSFTASKAFDEYLYFMLLRSRWMNDKIWPQLKATFFQPIPQPIRLFVPDMIRRQMRKTLWQQGAGRFEEAELQRRLLEFCQHVSTLLGDQRYFCGEKISSLDVTAFAFLFHGTLFPLHSTYHEAAENFPNLKRYVDHIREQHYPQMDLSIWQ